MSITASKYINNSELKTSYIGLFHYTRPQRGKKDVGIEIYGLLSVASEVEIPGDKIAKFAWDGIVDGFEYSKLDSANESLKLSLTEATRRVKQLIMNDNGIAQHGVDINFTVFISSNGGVYIGVLGESDIYVYKKGRLVDIYEMLSSKRAKTAAVAIDPGDLVFASTKNLLREDIKKIINTKGRDELIPVLEEIGREVKDDTGLIILAKELEEKNLPVLEPEKKEEEVVAKSDTSDSDYIATSKVPKKLFKSVDEDRDLKYFFTVIVQKLSLLKGNFSPILLPLKKILSKFFKRIGELLKKFISNLKVSFSKAFSRKRWFKKVSATVSQSGVLKKKEKKFEGFKIDGYKEKNIRNKRLKILFLVILGIGLLLGGIKFTIDQKESRELSKIANESFIKVEGFLKNAESKIRTDKDSAILYTYRASEELSKIPDGLKEKDLEKYAALEGQILGIEDTLFKRVRLSTQDKSIENFVDTVISMGADSNPSDIGMYRDANGNEYLLITDLGLKKVYRVSLFDKSKPAELPDDEGVLQQPSMVYTKASGIYVLDKVNGVVKAEFSENWFKPFTKLSGLSIQNLGAKDIAEFAVLTENENVYVLDRAQRTLLKSTNFGTGYGLSFSYLSKDEYAEANDVLSDLSVYILTPGENGIHRYVNTINGIVESPIGIDGLDTPLKNARYGYTADNLNKSFFIFDSEDRRILRFEKPLESGEIRHPNKLLLLNQYLAPEGSSNIWSKVKDFVVDSEEKHLYILDGTKVWKVRL